MKRVVLGLALSIGINAAFGFEGVVDKGLNWKKHFGKYGYNDKQIAEMKQFVIDAMACGGISMMGIGNVRYDSSINRIKYDRPAYVKPEEEMEYSMYNIGVFSGCIIGAAIRNKMDGEVYKKISEYMDMLMYPMYIGYQNFMLISGEIKEGK